jgi:P4 family phage/plasmid primase-like protien
MLKQWTNFFVTSIGAKGNEGHINAQDLPLKIKNHNGAEAYHCAFNLEPRENFNDYDGEVSPALGYAWFDFDSKEDISRAHNDTRQFVAWLGVSCLVFYSGSKGFHVGVPLGYFGISPSKELSGQLNAFAKFLKKNFYPTLDTTIYNPNRKFRVPGSMHPKTGLYKRLISGEQLQSTIEVIKTLAKERGPLEINIAPPDCAPLEKLTSILSQSNPQQTKSNQNDSLSIEEWRRYRQPRGEEAFKQCLFLAYCKDNPAKISEPEWYAAASIVGRFENGRTQFHAISKEHPNYSKTECDEKLEQALQASGPRTCQGIDSIWGKCAECPLFGRIKSPVVIMEPDVIPTEATGFYDLIPVKDSNSGEVKRIPNYGDLLRAFKRDTEYFRDTESEYTYIWSGTHYRDFSETEIKAYAERNFLPSPPEKFRTEFLNKVLVNELQTKERLDDFFFKSIEGKLNLKNGVLDIKTGTLAPHSKEFGFRYVLPYEFDPSAQAPIFESFLNEITLGRAGLKQTLLEFMGYCLWPSYDDHCFLWLTGGGRNGKSTFMEVLSALVGEQNTSTVLLDHFNNPHYLEMLNHKLVNLSEESDAGKIPTEILSKLKTLSAGGKVPVDKKYGHPYQMRNMAKLAFAANSPPLLGEAQDAIKSRMIVVPFDLRLEDHMTGENRIKADMLAQMIPELPGILNIVLRSLQGFLSRLPRKIYRDGESKAALNDMVRDSDPVERWVQDRVVLCSQEIGVPSSELYLNFKQYIMNGDEENARIPEAHWFGRRLKQKLGNRIVSKPGKWLDKTVQMVYGISLSKDVETMC